MKKTKYHSPEWKEFSDRVKKRDGYCCIKCSRSSNDVVLQVHHEEYISGKAPWDYPLSSCITLCKGCHAKEHGLIQPSSDWVLVPITDLGARTGECKRHKCGVSIQHEHEIYHPSYGYLNVGSVCVEYLTQEMADKSRDILRIHTGIRNFIKKRWVRNLICIDSNNFETLYIRHGNHDLILCKVEGGHKLIISKKKQTINEKLWTKKLLVSELDAKELIYIVSRGIKASKESEKKLLKDIYYGYLESS